jgi:Tfp pilus assembly PilM family ATPase
MGNLKFYRDEPLFGLDIGHSSLKAMQVQSAPGKQPEVLGYGSSPFDPTALENGVIVKPQAIAEAMHKLFEKSLVGTITSRRVACSLPTSRTFSRPMKLPVMDVFDKTLLVASTINTGGDHLTEMIAQHLHLTHDQASSLKNEYGISYSERQQRVIDAIKPILATLSSEIQKSIRYYSERASKSGREISQIVIVGGGSIMPGLSQYLTKELHLPAQVLDPRQKISFGHLSPPAEADRAIYTIATGEALVNPKEALL